MSATASKPKKPAKPAKASRRRTPAPRRKSSEAPVAQLVGDAGSQQPKETPQAFEAFRCYLEMGLERSTAAVARELGKSKTIMDRWSSRWRWVERVRLHENQAVATADFASREVRAERAKRHAEITRLHQEALALPARELLRRLRDDPNLMSKLSIKELLALEAAAARVLPDVIASERRALGMDDDDREPTRPLVNLNLITDDGLRRDMAALRERFASARAIEPGRPATGD